MTRDVVRPAAPSGVSDAVVGPDVGSALASASESTAGELRRMLVAGELDLPLPGSGGTARRWAALAEWGGRDLSLARLGEGHVDAVAILADAGRLPGRARSTGCGRPGRAERPYGWSGGAMRGSCEVRCGSAPGPACSTVPW
jgi:hypothetical protein